MATSDFEVHQHSVPIALESMTCFGQQIFLTTATGHLLTYLVTVDPKIEFTLLKHDHNFATDRVMQIDTAPLLNYGLLFSLSSNVIKVHEIGKKSDTNNIYSSYKMLYHLSCKATAFAINKMISAENSRVQLCMVAGKMLRFYDWKENHLQQQYRRFVQLDSTPEQIMWYKSHICIGFTTGFSVYNLATKTFQKVEGPENSVSPCITLINGFYCVFKGNNFAAIDRNTGGTSNAPFEPVNWSNSIVQLVWDRPYVFGISPDDVQVLRLKNGQFCNPRKLPMIDAAKYLVRLDKGLLCAASDTVLYCITKSKEYFYCYNCGEENNHHSKTCTVLDQQFSRCPECEVVAKTKAGHKISCRNTDFISTKIGNYELALLTSSKIRISCNAADQIYCEENNFNFLITKFFSVGTNIQIRRIYGSKDLVFEIKFKPTITISFGRINEEKNQISMMCCSDQIRINHYYHVDKQGNVTYNLSSRPRLDKDHDLKIKIGAKAFPIPLYFSWNGVEATINMSKSGVTIH